VTGTGLAALAHGEHYAIVAPGLPGPAALIAVTADADPRAAGFAERAAEACAKQLSADGHTYSVDHVTGPGERRACHAQFAGGRLIWRRGNSPGAVQEVAGCVPDGRDDWSGSDG
jgi:hypothetical protein